MQAFQSKKLKAILQNPEETEELRKSISAVTKPRGGAAIGSSARINISFKRDKAAAPPRGKKTK